MFDIFIVYPSKHSIKVSQRKKSTSLTFIQKNLWNQLYSSTGYIFFEHILAFFKPVSLNAGDDSVCFIKPKDNALTTAPQSVVLGALWTL